MVDDGGVFADLLGGKCPHSGLRYVLTCPEHPSEVVLKMQSQS
jgi:hypothetical protein